MPMKDQTSPGLHRDQVAVAQHLGSNVKRMRQERGWSQTALAHELGILGLLLRQTTMTKLEGGVRPTSADELWALASVFEVPYDDLLPTPLWTRVDSADAKWALRVAGKRRQNAKEWAEKLKEEATRAAEQAADAERRYQAAAADQKFLLVFHNSREVP